MEYWSNGVNEIPNSKHQITSKSQIPIPNDQNKKTRWEFRILVIVICLIFVICDLEFSVTPLLEHEIHIHLFSETDS